MTTSELALLGTNILVYAADETSEFHAPAKQLRDWGVQGDIPVAISPQILFEFFAVITNFRRVTQPRSPQEAREEMEKYLHANAIRKISPGEDIINRVLILLQQHPQITRQDILMVCWWRPCRRMGSGASIRITASISHPFPILRC